MVTSCADGSVGLWDACTGEWCTSFMGHDLSVMSVSLSPDGRCIASGSSDHTLRLWSIEGPWRRVLRGHRGAVLAVSFAHGGERLVSASSDRTARLWSRDGTALEVLRGHRRDVSCAIFTALDQELLTASDDCSVVVWDATDLRRLQRLQLAQRVHGLACQEQLAVAFARSVEVYGRQGHVVQELRHCLRQKAMVFSCAWLALELAVALQDGTVVLWDVTAGAERDLWPWNFMLLEGF